MEQENSQNSRLVQRFEVSDSCHQYLLINLSTKSEGKVFMLFLRLDATFGFLSRCKKRASRTSPAQYEELASYMMSHSAFAAGKFLGKEGKVSFDQQWGTLAERLNAVSGGAQKNVAQWRTVSKRTK
jgi:hypothetical protein